MPQYSWCNLSSHISHVLPQRHAETMRCLSSLSVTFPSKYWSFKLCEYTKQASVMDFQTIQILKWYPQPNQNGQLPTGAIFGKSWICSLSILNSCHGHWAVENIRKLYKCSISYTYIYCYFSDRSWMVTKILGNVIFGMWSILKMMGQWAALNWPLYITLLFQKFIKFQVPSQDFSTPYDTHGPAATSQEIQRWAATSNLDSAPLEGSRHHVWTFRLRLGAWCKCQASHTNVAWKWRVLLQG